MSRTWILAAVLWIALPAAIGGQDVVDGSGHDVWTVAFAEPGLAGWLFAQKRERG